MTDSAFFKSLFDGMRCGILSIDRNGRLVVVNELAAQILELDEIPEPGVSMDAALSRHPRLIQVLRGCFEASTLPNREEIVLGQSAGDAKTIGYTVSLISPDQGPPAGAAMFFKDLTLIERKEEQERLRDRLAALGQMTACMAHEIRNPLASIDVTCSLLRRRLDGDPAACELLDKVTAEVKRLNSTITSSLEFVRPVSLVRSRHQILQVLEDAIRVAVDRSRKPVHVEKGFPAEVPAFLMDRTQLRQVFENLLLNAAEAVDDDGQIGVEVSVHEPDDGIDEHDRWVQVSVTDSGPGIPEGDEEKIFYPFFTTKKRGSGVGLSMVKKIVDSHRGAIEVANADGGGAVFTVRIPMLSGQPAD